MTTAASRQQDILIIDTDDDDFFQYEEVAVDDEDLSLTDGALDGGEEDLEATVRAIRGDRGGDGARAIIAVPPKPHQRTAEQPVDDFVRSFLLKMGMTQTLDCFQREWHEMAQKGLLRPEQVGVVPDVYTQTQRLDQELRNTQTERNEYRLVSSAAAETLVKLQKERDFHRMHHERVVQEKNRLIEDLRRLKVHHSKYEPAVTQMNDKYQAALRQKILVGMERDKALAQVNSLQAALHSIVSPPLPSALSTGWGEAQSDKSNRRARGLTDVASKDPAAKTANVSKHSEDSEFPVNFRAYNNPQNHQSIDASVPTNTKAESFHLTNTLKAHSQSVSCLAAHPTKPIMASSSDDQLWRVWALPEGDLIATGEGHTDWLSGISFHPDETKLGTTGGDGGLRIWDLSLGFLVLTLEGHTGATWGCSFHSCGNFVASCSRDCTIKVWDLQSERCRATLRGHTASVNSVEFLSFSNTLLSSSADKTLAMWDARTAICGQTVCGHTSSCNHATFSPSGQTIASCDCRGVVMLWDVRNLVAPAVIVETGPQPSNQVAFSPVGQMLAVAGGDGLLRVVDLSTNKVTCTLSHEDAVQSVVFDRKGEHLLSGASDGQIYVWS